MTVEFGKNLSEKLGLNEDSQALIQEAWDNKLSEARDLIAAELREEFAEKFEHDKEIMIESMDKFLEKELRSKLEEIAEEKKALVSERVEYKRKVDEHVKTIDKFVNSILAKEVKELRDDRSTQMENVKQLENFVLQQLTEEIAQVREDKKAIIEQRVKLVNEGKKQLHETKDKFLKGASKIVNEHVDNILRKEITQFKDDIKEARQNDFGRKIFESFAAEYLSSHLNEKSEIKGLQNEVSELKKVLESKESKIQEAQQLVESANKKAFAAKDAMRRDRVMSGLLSPLGKEKGRIMKDLLESVKTDDLQKAYDKYLPSVLNESSKKGSVDNRTVIEESTSIKTGNRAKSVQTDQSDNEIAQLKKLAGL